MLKITQEMVGSPAEWVLKLEGKIVGEWSGELQRVCDECLRENKKITLDLSNVSFLDVHGIEILKQLMTRNVVVRNYSMFLKQLMDHYE